MYVSWTIWGLSNLLCVFVNFQVSVKVDLVESSMLISIKYKLRGILTCKQQSQCNWIYNLFLFLRWPQPRRVERGNTIVLQDQEKTRWRRNVSRKLDTSMHFANVCCFTKILEAFYKYKMTQLAKFRKTKVFSFKAKFQVFCTMLIFLPKNTLRHFLKIFIPLVLCLKLLNFPAQKYACAIFLKNLCK